jgi:hypothetical protein
MYGAIDLVVDLIYEEEEQAKATLPPGKEKPS